jgi:ubiquinone/menaquinone biosynthesis C-methylase UbiE
MRDQDRRRDFWNCRATLGYTAGTDDFVMKKMEIDAIKNRIRHGMKILDFGCGNGITALAIAEDIDAHIVGIDYAEEMIAYAIKAVQNTALKGHMEFLVGDGNMLGSLDADFDLAYTERCLINFETWEAQLETIKKILSVLRVGGKFIMCENSADGLAEINRLRLPLGLNMIESPWHNRYFNDYEINTAVIENAKLVEVDSFSSTYYFLSRVINAALAKNDGLAPRYDDAINMLAMKLPALTFCSQVKIWIWEKLE